MHESTKKRLVLAGHGMVGQKLLEMWAKADTAGQWAVTVLCEEPRPAYDRVHLSEVFAGRDADTLALAAPDFFDEHGIDARIGVRAVAIDRAARTVTDSSGALHPYDALVLATGSSAFVPPVPGADAPGCFAYRTIEDLEAIRAHAAGRTRGVVVGGGLLGLEAAQALLNLGLQADVVELAPRLMAVQLDATGGDLLARMVSALGVGVHTDRRTESIVPTGTGGLRLNFAGGDTLDTELVVFSAGIRPRDELARAAGLAIGARGGVEIDDACRTSDPAIFAIGECAAWRGQTFGLVAPGYAMARVVADALTADGEARFEGADMSTKLKLLGVEVASFGDAHAQTPGALTYAWRDEARSVYKKIVVDPEGARLVGGLLLGDASEYDGLVHVLRSGATLPPDPSDLILPARSGAERPSIGGPETMAESALICSCNNVEKGAICRAVDAGHVELADIKRETCAGTGCGGCVPLVGKLLSLELARRGVAVSNHLCEHFPHSRQDLFHLVRVRGYRTFDALLANHGQGHGCEVCKPTVSSILASCHNEHILEPSHAGLQDTNDRFLANIQRDGSYSVVPRVPGGEITADKLIAIGQVAKKYDLYTKITGGQRVDLFGAQLSQLPDIWRELVAHGFESGHAYGKAVRTVKTCVGSTWCRYGVQDSVGLGIRLEHRYKGIRAPHKLKLAVSGCTRECAEAQSKDVGIIATQEGYNLYVGGNGGLQPRHAELLATDLDEATLVRTIDRFLMLYIRSADRLMRTARWVEGLEGGVEYLRAVLLHDSLGLGAELEAEMAHLVGTYRCEWAVTLEDPMKLRQFRTFVNNDAADDDLPYVREREQRRPASPSEAAAIQKGAI
ncbi:MAG: nitrite reductase large subunit NirB [Myxococcota bacterium]